MTTGSDDSYWKYVVERDRDLFLGSSRRGELLELIKAWGALRGTGLSLDGLGRVLKKWVRSNRRDLQALRGIPIVALSRAQVAQVGMMYWDLRKKRRLGPTCSAKLLHFLLPESVCLWDTEKVRHGTYWLGDSETDFVKYQEMGQGLARFFVAEEGSAAISLIEKRHFRALRQKGWITHFAPGQVEAFPKIFDELVYEGIWCRAALKKLGLWDPFG